MGDIFCLIVLESGSRRKVTLRTGTYDELLGSLVGIVEIDSNNTLIQILDTDLDDYVDLLPGDIVPNKAKLRVIQKTASVPGGNAVLSISSPLPQSVEDQPEDSESSGTMVADDKTGICKDIVTYPSGSHCSAAVNTPLVKCPHLPGSDDKTGQQVWVDRLKVKFRNVRHRLPDDMLSIYDYGGKGSSVVARRLVQKNADDKTNAKEAVRCSSRAMYLDKQRRITKLRTSKLKTSQQTNKDVASVATDELGQLLEAKARHETVKTMPVEQAIRAFPSFRQESSLLAEFNALWKVDIVEAFEKGIKRLFCVLMNSGTPQEITAISKGEGDMLQVVLDAIAKRCREKMTALLTEDSPYPTPCLVKRANGSLEVFVDGHFLFIASSLLRGVCALFASFWVFHIEYPRDARKMLTFIEHAFLGLDYSKPQLKTLELINLYRGTSP